MTQAFLSYARADEAAARLLDTELTQRGIDVIRVDRLALPGESWVSLIESAISKSDVVFVLVSPESERSQWVNAEVALALAQSEQGRPSTIVPVFLDPKSRSPFLLRSIQGVEFFDRDRSRVQLDSLAQSLSARETAPRGTSVKDISAEMSYIRSMKDALAHEVAAERRKQALRFSTIVATTTAASVVLGSAAIVVSLLNVGADIFNKWALPFVLGAGSSLSLSLLSAFIRRRLLPREPGGGN